MSKNKLSIFDFIDNDIEYMFEDEIQDNKNTNLTNEGTSIWENFDILDSKIKIINNEGDYEPLEFTLPSNFFEKMTNYEVDLYNDFSMDNLNSLIKLYSTAFQFYLENDPPKAKAYQNRMEYLLINKDTLFSLKKEKNINNNLSSSNKQIPNINKIFKIMQNNYKNRLEEINKIDLIEKTNDLIIFDDKERNINNKKNIQNIINDDVEKQNEKWKKKLKTKKRIINRKTFGLKTPNPSDKRVNLKLGENDFLCFGLNKNEKNNINKSNDNYNEIDEDSFEEYNEKIKIKDDSDINYINHIIERHHNNKEINNNEDEKSNNTELNKIEEVVEDYEINDDCPNKKQNEKNNDINSGNEVKKYDNLNINLNFKNKDNEKMNDKIDENKIEKLSQDNYLKGKTGKNNNKEKSIEENNEKIKLDDEIINILNEKIELINNLNNIKEENDDINIDLEFNNNNNINSDKIRNIPIKFRDTYLNVEKKMNDYIIELKRHFYNDIFENFFFSIKKLYDLKYKKYIEIKNEYHSNITENEFLLESEENLDDNKKNEIIQIIETLKEELQYQIDKISDEFNGLINQKINEFKINSFKGVRIQLIEEQLKLDIYTLINESFY